MTNGSPWVPRWTVLLTFASGVFAPLTFVVGIPYGSHAAAVAGVGLTYVLYKWGQHRERRSKYSDDDETRRREMEQKGRIGGFGGNQ